jgi:hypothetical protein
MKTPLLCLVGTVLVGLNGFAQQSYTIPIVHGYNLIANELDYTSAHDPSENTPQNVLPATGSSGNPSLKGCWLWKFKYGGSGYWWEGAVCHPITGVWRDMAGGPVTLSPGEGAFLANPRQPFLLTFNGYRRPGNPVVLVDPYGLYSCQDNDIPDPTHWGNPDPLRRTFQDVLSWPANQNPASRTRWIEWDPVVQAYRAKNYTGGLGWSPLPAPRANMGQSVWILPPPTSLTSSDQVESDDSPFVPPPYLLGYATTEGSVISLNLEWVDFAYLQQANDCAGPWTYVLDSQSGQPVTSPYVEPLAPQSSKLFRLTSTAPAK